MKDKNNSQYGTMWINDGFSNKKWKKDEDIPSGWFRGRINVHTEEYKKKISEASRTNNNPEKRKQTLIRRYGTTDTSIFPNHKKSMDVYSANLHFKRINMPFDEKPMTYKRLSILDEQNYSCLWCGVYEWNHEPIVLELDHIDGNTDNNNRENLRFLCPNCHSQTPTWRRNK